MGETQAVFQLQFKTLEEFIARINNFYLYFLGDSSSMYAKFYRSQPVFRRFQEEYLQIERELTEATVQAVKAQQRLPYEQLFEAYNIMSHLVFTEDFGVMRDGILDTHFLIR